MFVMFIGTVYTSFFHSLFLVQNLSDYFMHQYVVHYVTSYNDLENAPDQIAVYNVTVTNACERNYRKPLSRGDSAMPFSNQC